MIATDKDPKPQPELLSAYRFHQTVSTRWSDNDVYGHVNNAVYFHWFDAVLNAYLMSQDLLSLHQPDVIGLMVETHCNYFDSLAYPEAVKVGLRVARIGGSSVRYEMAAFGQSTSCAAKGHLVHVYVDPVSRRPVALPEKWRVALERLQ